MWSMFTSKYRPSALHSSFHFDLIYLVLILTGRIQVRLMYQVDAMFDASKGNAATHGQWIGRIECVPIFCIPIKGPSKEF